MPQSDALMSATPCVCVDTLALAHGVRPDARQTFLEQADAAAKACGAQLIWPVLVDGALAAKLSAAEFDAVCRRSDFGKIGTARLGLAQVRSLTGGLTAAATLAVGSILAADAVVTGGLGGIHRGRLNDLSADLHAVSRSRLPLVCSGFKPFIDAGASIAVLEAASVPIFHIDQGGWPCLYANDPGQRFGEKLRDGNEMAGALAAQARLAHGDLGSLCVMSVPEHAALSLTEVETCCAAAIEAASVIEVQGSALTPWLVKAMRDALGVGLDLANEAALMKNIIAASKLAVRLAATSER